MQFTKKIFNYKLYNLISPFLYKHIMTNLFGAFAIHNPESCPMNNVEAKKVFLEIKDKLEKNKSDYGVKKIKVSICRT